MSIRKAVYEHLKTKKKYNTLEIKFLGAKEDIERLTVELNTQKRIHAKRQEIWEKALKEQEEEIIKLKKMKVKNASNNKEKN